LEFSKQGFDTETALKLSKVASEFQNIADTEIDAATAAKFINSQLKAFGNTEGFKNLTSDAEKAERVIDAVNEVANNFGVGTNDLQMALTKTGAALKGYGNSYSQTIGLITAGTEMLPNQASKVARGWRTIGANVLKLAQSEETLSAANGKVNISLRDSQGNMKSTFAILKDLYKGVEGQSVAWKDLSQEEQSAISLMLAGKTQTEVFKSTMDNFSQAIKANRTAINSQGSAAIENAKYLDSIQGKLATFSSAWQQFSYHFMNSDFLKSAIDFGTKVINILDTLITKTGITFPKALGILGTVFGGIKIVKFISSLNDASSVLGKLLGVAGDASKAASVVGEATVEMASDAAVGTSGIAGLVAKLGGLSTILPVVAGLVIALGGAFVIANAQYNNSFQGKVDKYKEITNSVNDLQEQIDILKSKEGDLTTEEEKQLRILETKLELEKKRQELAKKEANEAYDKEAKEKRKDSEEKSGYVHKEGYNVNDMSGDTTATGNYLKAQRERLLLDKEIAAYEADAKKFGIELDEKATKKLEERYDTAIKNEEKWLSKLYDEYELLSELDYSTLSNEGKTDYNATVTAYLQSLTEIKEVQDAIQSSVSTFGAEQFEGWNIDISSLKSAADLAGQIKDRISDLDDEETITIYAHDETGNVINEIQRKKGDLTDDEWNLVIDATTTGNYDELKKYIDSGESQHSEVLIDFIPKGLEEVEADKEEAAQSAEAEIKLRQEGLAEFMANKKNAMAPGTTPITVTDQGTAGQTKGQIDAIKGHDVTIPVNQGGATTSGIQSSINGVKGKDVHINIFKTIWESVKKKKAKGKKKGEEGGMAWLGDEGSRSNPKPELVVGEDGAYLAGTDGWELRNLKSSDTVYSASQTKKLLSDGDFDIASIELPRFKKGKKAKKTAATNANVKKASNKVKKAKSKSAKKKAKKQLKSLKARRQKKRDAFDKEVENLKHKAKVNHWTDAKYQKEYKKLYNKYKAYLSGDQSDDYTESAAEYDNSADKDEVERLTGLVGIGALTAASAVASINAQSGLSADEKQDYIAKAYQESVEYNLKEYKNGKATRQQILSDIENYYKTRGKYDEDYYKMLDELREADKEKETDRLKELQKAQENRLSLAQKYIQKELDSVNKQIDAEKEELELEKDLAQAKNKMIRIYREGQGFVYEEDVEAIQEAQKALEKTPLEQRAEELQAILDLFDEMADNSAIRELEVLLGVSGISGTTGGLTTNSSLDAWASWIKGAYASSMGYADLITKLEKIGTSDINSWLTANGGLNVSDSVIAQYINNHSFASGTLSAPGGLSRVAERLGGELVWLGKGDSVYSNAVSRNLMEWGQYTPAQVMNSNSSAQSQIFNFDKIVLPNVHNAEEFYRELQNLPNKALQQSTRRV
jgi:TP901 family phage tail tape measure protein